MGEPTERKTDGNGAPQAQGASQNPLLVISSVVGSIFATLCCIGLAPLVALVMAAGLGFIMTFTVLLPMLLFFLAVGGYGLWRSYRRHGTIFPLIVHAVAGILIVALIYSFLHGPLIWVGLVGIMAAAFWNIRLEYVYWHREPEVDFSRSA